MTCFHSVCTVVPQQESAEVDDSVLQRSQNRPLNKKHKEICIIYPLDIVYPIRIILFITIHACCPGTWYKVKLRLCRKPIAVMAVQWQLH